MAASYPKPMKPTPPYESIKPRPLHPLRPPPKNSQIPNLPAHIENFRRGVVNILPGFILSTHIFPAATPRTKCGQERIPHFSEERGKRTEEASIAAKGLVELRQDWLPAVYDCKGDEGPLWLSVNRFSRPGGVRLPSGKQALTLWLLHANGFHKEVRGYCYLWVVWPRLMHTHALGSLDLGGDVKVYYFQRAGILLD
jgi:hypothetical protein